MAKVGRGRRLGRGLSSLMSMGELPVRAEMGQDEGLEHGAEGDSAGERQGQAVPRGTGTGMGAPLEIPLDQIVPNPHQPRRQWNEAGLAELAASLKSTGVIQPIIVRPAESGGYQLVAGERRWRASRLAGLATIPAIVRAMDGFTQAQMALVENIQREDLNPMDRAQGYKMLIEQLGLTQAELAGRLGEDRSTIANFVRLLELAEPVRKLIREGQLSLGHAKLIAGVVDVLEQERLGNLVVSQGLSVRNVERLIAGTATPAPRPAAQPSAHIPQLERSLSSQLGMRVQVRSASKGRGKLIIHYGSLDQFDEITGKLGLSTS